MKPWSYYCTPVKHPWANSKDIDNFCKTYNLGATEKFIVANYIWHRDDETKSELSGLEYEFMVDICKEFDITPEKYQEIDPYDNIIGCPENHDYPCENQFQEMYEYVKKELGQ